MEKILKSIRPKNEDEKCALKIILYYFTPEKPKPTCVRLSDLELMQILGGIHETLSDFKEITGLNSAGIKELVKRNLYRVPKMSGKTYKTGIIDFCVFSNRLGCSKRGLKTMTPRRRFTHSSTIPRGQLSSRSCSRLTKIYAPSFPV